MTYAKNKGNPANVEESVLITDNSKTQTKPEWHRLLWKKARTKSHLFPAGMTNEMQTIDDTVGYMTKGNMGGSHSEWVAKEHDDGRSNLDRMVAREVKASERRILLKNSR